MLNLSTITKDQILKIEEYEPERLFSDPNNISHEYKILAKKFHPDNLDTGDEDTFQHLYSLKEKANAKIKAGEWHIPGLLELSGIDSKIYRIRYLKEFDFGLGRAFIANGFVAYLFDPLFEDQANHAYKVIPNFPYPHPDVKKEMEFRLTKIKQRIITTKGTLLLLEKPTDTIRLLDLVEHHKGSIDPKHAAWILTRLYSICCYLEKVGLTHNDISLDTIFIQPANHTAHLIGGWWFSSKIGTKMQKKQSGRTVAFAPRSVITSKIADIKTDLELVRLTGRELLGDDTGSKLINSKTIPKPLVDWLRLASTGNAESDYKLWEACLIQSFGARRFVKLEVQSSDIYKGF
jgi:serine/threonine protein kinase